MKKLFYIFTILFPLCTTTAQGNDTQACIDGWSTNAKLYWHNYDQLPTECQEKVKAAVDTPITSTRYSFSCNGIIHMCTQGQKPSECAPCAISLLSARFSDDFSAKFGEIACQNNATDTWKRIMDEYEEYYPDWAKQACEIIFTQNASSAPITQSGSRNEQPTTSAQSTTANQFLPATGYIKDNQGEPLTGASVIITESQTNIGTPCGTSADTDGFWKIDLCTYVPENPQLEISYIGYDKQTIPLTSYNNKTTITLNESSQGLDELIVEECSPTSTDQPGATKRTHASDGKCYPSECDETRYKLTGTDKNARCVEKDCKPQNARTGVWTGRAGAWECQVKECKNDKFKPNENKDACIERLRECTDEQKAEHPYASETGIKEGTETCIATECKCGYTLNNEKCEKWPEVMQCTSETKPALPDNATGAIMKCNSRGKAYCEVTGCKTNYTENKDKTKCTVLKGECTHTDANARKAKYKKVNGNRVCVITDCKDGYLPSDDGQKCEVSEGPCNESQLKTLEHATAGELKKGKCRATACESGYEVEKHKCVEIAGNCNPKPENAKKSHREFDSESGTEICIIDECKKDYKVSDDKKSCVAIEKAKLSREDSQKKIDELQKNADAMKEKEHSTANKLLGGATMAATGLGAMQAMSAYSEQQADEDAEEAMKAYLATFHCNYGGGKNVQGGEKDVQLPGGNELVDLYAEYVNLANNLKVRKAALDMRPGIEAESILDSATSGLYDDVAIGKTSGAFTSLARALQDPNGADAAAWAEQKDKTAKNLKTGLTIAGVGAVAGAVGNLLINKNAPKENSKEINQKYEKLKQKVEEVQNVINQLPTPTCNDYTSKGVSGGTYPNCTCANSQARFFTEQGCIACTSGQEYNAENQCVPIGCKLTGLIKEGQCSCIDTAKQNGNTCTCKLTGVVNSATCTCGENTTQEGDNCKCKADTHEEKDGKCVEKQNSIISVQPATEPIKLEIPADVTFESSKATLKPNAKQRIANALKTALGDDEAKQAINGFKITITGHTDRVPFKSGSTMNNQKLSEQRAAAIAQLFTDADVPSNLITTEGKAETECTADKYPERNDEKCRRVDVVISTETTGIDFSTITDKINLGELANKLTSQN